MNGMGRFILIKLRVAVAAWIAFKAASAAAQTIDFISIAAGYEKDSIALPRPFAGALAADPSDEGVIYAALGSFGDMELARVNLASRSVVTVAAGPFGSIGGIAVISSTRIVIVENGAAVGNNLTSETLLLASDVNPPDGDFDDPGEIAELIAPILTHPSFAFTGAQARIAPPGNASAIPAGSLLVQTADGNGLAELLVVENPLTAPAFRPAGGAYFTGFDFNGGFDFDRAGRIFMGAVEGASFTGDVFALVNTNGDEDIDPGESHRVITGEGGMADLVIDAEDDVHFAGVAGFSSALRTFRVPADPLSANLSAATLAESDAGFLSTLIVTSSVRPFEPYSGPAGATLVTSGFTASFAPAMNLLLLRPSAPNAARRWVKYE